MPTEEADWGVELAFIQTSHVTIEYVIVLLNRLLLVLNLRQQLNRIEQGCRLSSYTVQRRSAVVASFDFKPRQKAAAHLMPCVV